VVSQTDRKTKASRIVVKL